MTTTETKTEEFPKFVKNVATELMKVATPNNTWNKLVRSDDPIDNTIYIQYWIFKFVPSETAFQRIAFLFAAAPYGPPDRLSTDWIKNQYDCFSNDQKAV